MFVPIGLDDMKVGRIPMVSLTVAALCVLLFPLTQSMGDDAFATFGLIPADGLVQAGWLTALFVHADIWHLLGNMLFLYIAAPCVEDAWGRHRFAALYVVGGLAASAGQVLLEPSSATPVVGASGAIAACMGALCVQFPRRKVRMFYWVYLYAGTFFLPVWLWGGFWFARELFYFSLVGTTSGVALGAHLAGFAFGAALAFAIIKIQGDPFEAKYGTRPTLPPPPAAPRPAPVVASAPALDPLPPIEAAPQQLTPAPVENAELPPSPFPSASPRPPTTDRDKTPRKPARAFPKRPRARDHE